MSWHKIPLTPEQKEFGFVDIIRAELEEVWISRGAPPGVSVWLEEHEAGGAVVYLSEVAAELAGPLVLRFGGVACEEPDKKQLVFLLGAAFRDDLA